MTSSSHLLFFSPAPLRKMYHRMPITTSSSLSLHRIERRRGKQDRGRRKRIDKSYLTCNALPTLVPNENGVDFSLKNASFDAMAKVEEFWDSVGNNVESWLNGSLGTQIQNIFKSSALLDDISNVFEQKMKQVHTILETDTVQLIMNAINSPENISKTSLEAFGNLQATFKDQGIDVFHIKNTIDRIITFTIDSDEIDFEKLKIACERVLEAMNDFAINVYSNQLQSLTAESHKIYIPTNIDWTSFYNHIISFSYSLSIPSNPGSLISYAVIFGIICVVSNINADVDSRSGVESGTDSLPYYYDSEAIRQYYQKRPVTVLLRVMAVLLESSPVILMLNQKKKRETTKNSNGRLTGSLEQSDYKNNDIDDQDELISKKIVHVLTKLGPTFIKAGQAASIRSDILPPVYARALTSLQDKLAPFDSNLAKTTIRQELGSETEDLFESISESPIAAASLGQVYKAKLRMRDGSAYSKIDVAVKVQRPQVRSTICLDLFLMRLAAPLIRKRFQLNSDLTALVDEWGLRFLAELDYLSEANNATFFNSKMSELNLSDAVFAPEVIQVATSDKVLTTRWIDGKRLDQITVEDIRGSSNSIPTDSGEEQWSNSNSEVLRLCKLALNTYLVMLCETGRLHADPHPGNLLRQNSDGRLCILDWGLVTTVEKEKQVALIEYIAHLTNEQWNDVPRDLVTLGFVPPSKVDVVLHQSDIARVLGISLKAITSGGGAKQVTSKLLAVSNELRMTQKKYGNLFQVPPYFAYILRTFNILEGISLSADNDYSITSECYPYLARRLLTDDDPRIHAALGSLLFVDVNGSRQLNVKRFRKLTTAYTTFAESASGLSTEYTGHEDSKDVSRWRTSGTHEVAQLLLSQDGNYIQQLLIEEAARAIDVTSRSTIHSIMNSVPGILDNEENKALLGNLLNSTSDALSVASTSIRRFLPEEFVTAIDNSIFSSDENSQHESQPVVESRIDMFPAVAINALRSAIVNDLDDDDIETMNTLRELRSIIRDTSSKRAPFDGNEIVNTVMKINPDDVSRYAPDVLVAAVKVGDAVTRRVINKYKS